MFEKVMKHFEKIASIPHCSFETSQLALYLKSVAKEHNFEIQEDEVGNILCKKGNPTICLQSHYDMVCMGIAPKLELFEEDGWLKAKNSSLGADNGMGVAIMLSMMEVHKNLECLFTNDEEVGLIGAENLALKISSTKLLNLDSEDENEVIIGCAGGIDIFGTISAEQIPLNEDLQGFEIEVDNLDGGHSGIDIAKNVPSAIKLLANFLVENECKIVSFVGGERNNSIPKRAYAKVFSKHNLQSNHPNMSIKSFTCKEKTILKNSNNLLHAINSFSQGVRAYNEALNSVITSINLSTLKLKDNTIELEFYGRSMEQQGVLNLKSETTSLLKGFGFSVRYGRENEPWQPVENEFANEILKIAQKEIGTVSLHAIHAGLECGVIMKKQPSIVGVCSIGPTIEFPHSIRERCNLASVKKITHVVDKIIKTYT